MGVSLSDLLETFNENFSKSDLNAKSIDEKESGVETLKDENVPS